MSVPPAPSCRAGAGDDVAASLAAAAVESARPAPGSQRRGGAGLCRDPHGGRLASAGGGGGRGPGDGDLAGSARGHRAIPLTILDCTTMWPTPPMGAVETLLTNFPPCGLLLFAGSSDKDLAGMFRVLAPHFAAAVLTRYTTNLRATPPEQLAALWQAAGGGKYLLAEDPAVAWRTACSLAGPDDLICDPGRSSWLANSGRCCCPSRRMAPSALPLCVDDRTVAAA